MYVSDSLLTRVILILSPWVPAVFKALARDTTDTEIGKQQALLRILSSCRIELPFLPLIHPTQTPGSLRHMTQGATGVQRVERPLSK